MKVFKVLDGDYYWYAASTEEQALDRHAQALKEMDAICDVENVWECVPTDEFTYYGTDSGKPQTRTFAEWATVPDFSAAASW